ncbi:MAG: GGDEF domain-containing protein, partial [Lachnospiraceae bacterium]|nr:GGDEF domain-containing protein [Lachnospiraceae bacterium]
MAMVKTDLKDALTGLDRYEVYLEKLEKEIENVGDDRIMIVYTDIKHFKYINDTYGYKVGDSLLREFVNAFTEKEGIILCAARVYSDNFVTANRVPPDGLSNEEFRDKIYQMNKNWETKFRERYLNSRLQFCNGISVVDKNSRSLDSETAVSNANLARKVAK